VTRLYDAELRDNGLRVTQFTILSLLSRSGEVRQGDLGELASLDETTLTRSLRPLEKSGCVTIRAGADRREKLVAISKARKDKVEQARRRGRGFRNGCAAPYQAGHGITCSRPCRTSRKPPQIRHRGRLHEPITHRR
jgi:DNA-binding MarR family transcriptional regulator